MRFTNGEKVFSLCRTSTALPRDDIKALFEQFYCYLLVTGLYREGEGVVGVHWDINRLSDKVFEIPSGAYASGLNNLLAKGLKERFDALMAHRWLTQSERDTLGKFDGIFTPSTLSYRTLTGREILAIAYARGFSNDMMVIARYVAVTFGQLDFPSPKMVPRLRLSVFGNIHLIRPDEQSTSEEDQRSTVILEQPLLRYGSTSPQGDNVTALWALLSSQISTLCHSLEPGELLGDTLVNFMFLGNDHSEEKTVPAPRYASSLYMRRIIGLDGINPIEVSAMFYKNFLFGSLEVDKVSRRSVLDAIINLMMEKMGETHLDHLFLSNSYYQGLQGGSITRTKNTQTPRLLQCALEALDAEDPKESTDDTPEDSDGDLSSDNPFGDPDTDSSGFDPSAPPALTPKLGEDTIDLISFDKTGEGVNESLYRAAVVALNDRFRKDDSLPIPVSVRDQLDYWVNGFLYRTAIKETQDLIKSLHLQKYLKPVLTKGQ